MWGTIRDVAPIVADVATAMAFVAVAIQLWFIRKQTKVDAHLDFLRSEREIWKIALENPGVAPKLVQDVWKFAPGAEPSEELLFIFLVDNFWHAYMRRKAGFTSRESWAPFEIYMVNVLASTRGNLLWTHMKHLYHPDFVAHFDAAIERAAKTEIDR